MAKHRCQVCKKECKKLVENATERPAHAPFCSERCKLVDLQKWLGEVYVVPVDHQANLDDDH
jgi:hypothetical protein